MANILRLINNSYILVLLDEITGKCGGRMANF